MMDWNELMDIGAKAEEATLVEFSPHPVTDGEFAALGRNTLKLVDEVKRLGWIEARLQALVHTKREQAKKDLMDAQDAGLSTLGVNLRTISASTLELQAQELDEVLGRS